MSQELIEKLAECKRIADNHRRARDYHKEKCANLKQSIDQFDGLCKELKFHCERNKIATSNEIASLF